MRGTRTLIPPLAELSFDYVRSSGSGGQNVNKVNTKAILRWLVLASPALSEAQRQRFVARFRRRISEDGELRLTSDRYRSQARNAEDCLAKLAAMLLEIAAPPKPRRATRVPARERQRRLGSKRRRSEVKQGRRRPGPDAD